MKYRNRLFMGVSTAIAASAVVAGAAVSSGAMATDVPDESAAVSLVQVGADGVDAYECTFDAAQLDEVFGSIEAVTGDLPAEAVPVAGGGVVAFDTPIELSELEGDEVVGEFEVLEGEFEVLEGEVVGGEVVEGAIAVGSVAVGDAAGITDIDVRPGTAEECADLTAGFSVAIEEMPTTGATPED